jgi:inner membrane protein
MTDLSTHIPRVHSRSMGVKLIVVCLLALVMTIPALFVWSLIDDRSRRADEVVNEVGELVGGPQTFLCPIVAIPYVTPATIIKTGGSRSVRSVSGPWRSCG